MSGRNKRYLLDTNAVVGLLQGDPSLLDLTQDAEWLGISVITQIEFLAFAGISPDDIELFTRFLERIEIVGLSPHDTGLITAAINLRQEHRLKLPDAVIVASCIIKEAELLTADRRLLDLGGQIKSLRVRAFAP